MKKLNLLFVALIGASTFTFTSCTDECKDVVCENGGTCDEETGACDCPANFYGESCETECINGTYADGACTCDAGYEGDGCSIESREDMIASYTVADACSSSGAASFSVTVSKSSNSADGILISNFWGAFINQVTATVDGDNITIPSQDPDNDGYLVSGNGTYSNGTITLTYSVTDPGNGVDNCNSTWTKN